MSKAGKNKKDLVKVLEKYRGKDSLKYESACYLIANMPYHASANEIVLDKQYDNYFRKIDSLYNIFLGGKSIKDIKKINFYVSDSLKNALSAEFQSLPAPILSEGIPDIEKVSADFLIDNIEMAFYVWNNTPILKNMSFEEFKEWILPYRTSDECVSYKRSELYKLFYPVLSKNGMESIYYPIEWYKIYTLKKQRINYNSYLQEHIGMYDLFVRSLDFNCHNQVNWTCNIFRACGIPVNYEFTPQWSDRESKHFWCVSPDSTGIYKPYSIPYNNIGEDWDTNLKFAGKVYRKGFSVNKDSPFFIKQKNEFVPPIFDNPTLRDESFRYRQTVDLNLPFNVKSENKLAYLSFVKRSGLTPIAWGIINKDNTVSFKNVPVNMVFILSYYDGDILKPLGNPFILHSDQIVPYIHKPLTSNILKENILLSYSKKSLINNRTHLPDKYIKYKELKANYIEKETYIYLENSLWHIQPVNATMLIEVG